MSRHQRIAHIPMMPATRNRIALAMHMAADGMVLAPSADMASEASKLLAIMTAAIDYASPVRIGHRTDPASKAIMAALAVMGSVEARHDVTGRWGVTGDEAVTLRSAAGTFDSALRNIPYNVYEASRIFVEQALRPAPTTQTERTV